MRVFLGASRTVQPTGECISDHRTNSSSCSGPALSAVICTMVRSADIPAEIRSSRPRMPRLSPSLSTVISSFERSIPRRAACIAITVAQHDAREVLKNHPGLGSDALPPIARGMSVLISSPAGPTTRQLRPLSRVAMARAALARAFSGWTSKRLAQFLQCRTDLGTSHVHLHDSHARLDRLLDWSAALRHSLKARGYRPGRSPCL
jgi:hypothetical protein